MDQLGISSRESPHVGLCSDCQHVRRIESARGSTFYLCQRSATDQTYPKYPRLPVLACPGYEPLVPATKPELP